MKIILFTLSVILILSSCDKKERREAWLKSQAEKEAKVQEKENLKSELQSKVVELAFKDFKLGEPLSKCLFAAKKNNDIDNLKIQKGSIDESLEFTTLINNTKIDCKVCSYQDTITSLVLFTNNYELHKFLKKAYLEKYGDIFLFEEQEKKRENNDDSYFWEFKNGSIKMGTFTETKSTIKVKKGRENLNPKNLQNYEEEIDEYFKFMTIVYTDKKQQMKLAQIKKIEQEKNSELYKHQQDSIEQQEQELKSKVMNDI